VFGTGCDWELGRGGREGWSGDAVTTAGVWFEGAGIGVTGAGADVGVGVGVAGASTLIAALSPVASFPASRA
jgi:hypothetical protein